MHILLAVIGLSYRQEVGNNDLTPTLCQLQGIHLNKILKFNRLNNFVSS